MFCGFSFGLFGFFCSNISDKYILCDQYVGGDLFYKVVIFVEDDLQKVTLAICPLKGLYVLSAFREVSCQCFKEEIACHIPVYYDQPNGYTWETNTRPYPLKTFSILKMGIFHCYVSLPGGKSFI